MGLLFGLPPLYMALNTPPAIAPCRIDSTARVAESSKELQQYAVYVVRFQYHTSIIIEQRPGWQLGPPGAEQARFVEYSWGDRRFYMEANTSLPSVLSAVFLPTESVVYLQGHAQPPRLGKQVQQLYHRRVTGTTLRRLATALEQSIATGATGDRAASHPPVVRYPGRFYPGREFYIFWSDCNAWTVRQLAAADLADPGHLIIFAEQVQPQLRQFESEPSDAR